jgi:hypothetical protein
MATALIENELRDRGPGPDPDPDPDRDRETANATATMSTWLAACMYSLLATTRCWPHSRC